MEWGHSDVVKHLGGMVGQGLPGEMRYMEAHERDTCTPAGQERLSDGHPGWDGGTQGRCRQLNRMGDKDESSQMGRDTLGWMGGPRA